MKNHLWWFFFYQIMSYFSSFEMDSLIILPLMFSILNKYRIIFLKWFEQFLYSGKNITVTYCSPLLLLPGKVCDKSRSTFFLLEKNNITQITKVLSLILPIILVQIGILGEVITSTITSCIFSGIGYCHRVINFCCL